MSASAMVEVSYTTGEAAALTGVAYRTLDFWDRTGLVCPSIQRASGKGTDRLYSFRDLVAVRAARDLREKGVELRGIRPLVAQILDPSQSLEGNAVAVWKCSLVVWIIVRLDFVVNDLKRKGRTE